MKIKLIENLIKKIREDEKILVKKRHLKLHKGGRIFIKDKELEEIGFNPGEGVKLINVNESTFKIIPSIKKKNLVRETRNARAIIDLYVQALKEFEGDKFICEFRPGQIILKKGLVF